MTAVLWLFPCPEVAVARLIQYQQEVPQNTHFAMDLRAQGAPIIEDKMSSHQLRPLAIVGMACRFPKGLESIEALWSALKNRVSAIDSVPAERWTVERFYSSNPVAKGKSYMRRGGFLTHDVSQFDAAFFGISPRDAENMDPQQRLLLEVVWEAFENSGMLLPSYTAKKVGVYVGGFMLDHMITQMSEANRSAINQNTAAGMMMTMLSNRISHTFDFRGPSLSIDTACSSSLVAFHYACQDLWRNDAEMAVVGGANVMLRPEYPMGMCKGGFLSKDGECKSFDERGDGYGRGEGAGAVLVQPLEHAIRDGNPILATVLATGSNQDGRTPGISMPSGEAQRALIEEVCERNSIDPASIDYVECHGTGTSIGDPTESRAIGSVYGRARRERQLGPVIVGSIKSNIGHLEAAAGVAGVIKATLTVLHRQTTPLANLLTNNPEIELEDWNVRLSNELMPVGSSEAPIRAAINSFGYGGSNAHVILESPPEIAPEKNVETAGSEVAEDNQHKFPHFLPISGRSEAAVRSLANRYAERLQDEQLSLEDFLFSASFKRAPLSNRAVVSGHDRGALIAGLNALADDVASDSFVKGTQPFQGVRKPVFVFTGMGPQWWAMGQELYASEPIYRDAVVEADAIFEQISGFSILQEMLKAEEESQITLTEYAQPANFLIQIGVLAVLRAAGVHPSAVVGHSVGELGSAFAAGVLSLRDALTVCFHRSRLQASCKGTGAMIAVGLGKDQTAERIAPFADRVSLAAINGPSNVTIAGDANALAEIAATLTQDGIFNKALEVEVPYHSPMMDPIMDDLRQALTEVSPNVPSLPLYSTVTGALVEGVAYGADYWPQNVRQPVEFSTAILALLEAGYNNFLEIGPHPVLSTSIRDCIKVAGKDCRQLFTLRRNQPELNTLHRCIMGVFAEGCDIDWSVHNTVGNFVPLPNYAWQREHFWVENDRAKLGRIAPVENPMLGIQEAPGAPVYRVDFDHEPMAYLRDHVISGMPVLPAAGYVESILELARVQHPDANGYAVRDLKIAAPMIISEDRGLDCVTAYDPWERTATVRSLENGSVSAGQVHVTAKVSGVQQALPGVHDLEKLKGATTVSYDTEKFYSDLDSIGLSYGPAFQTVKELMSDAGREYVLARIEISPELAKDLELFCLHPTMLDACFQSLTILLGDSDITYLPTGFSELCVYNEHCPEVIWCLAEKKSQDERHIICNLTLLDQDSTTLATLRSMELTAASKRERRDRFGDRIKRQIINYNWTYGETLTEPKRLGHWLLVGDGTELVDTIRSSVEQFGAIVSGIVEFGDDYSEANGRFTIRPGSREDADRVLQSVGDLDGVAFLHGLGCKTESSDPTAEQSLLALVGFTKAMLDKYVSRQPRVYVVTQGGCAVNEQDKDVQPAQFALNGFCRVAFNELDGFRFSSIDLPAQPDLTVIENLALELVCDDEHDEVALRGSFRLHSELLDTPILSDDRVVQSQLDDEHPLLVRPLREDCESVGTARIVATTEPELTPNDLHLRILTSVVPTDLLLNPNADTIAQPLVEIVAEVLAFGSEVEGFTVGSRVCGFAPADLSSHLLAPASDFHLSEVDASLDASVVAGSIGGGVRVSTAVGSLEELEGLRVLVVDTKFGIAVANRLLRSGAHVTLLSSGAKALDGGLSSASVYSLCPEGIASAVEAETDGHGFELLAAPLQVWQTQFAFHMLKPGAGIIDLDATASPVSLPDTISSLVRTDYRLLQNRREAIRRALQETIEQIGAGEMEAPTTLDVSIADIGWQKLPLNDTSAKVILHYETAGSELPVVQHDDLKFDPDATYLITGGFGGFGRKTAEWLVEHGARHLVLTGRTGADTDERKEVVRTLQAQDAHVTPAACDTSDFAALQALFARVGDEMPPLKGIFHSGALILDQPIAEIDDETFQKVVRSKALGAWNLHLLTEHMQLDHFVMYSSVANFVGNSRQAAYCSANGFLNGLAHYRKSKGLPGTSVNWGAIADVGVVANDEKLEQFLRYTGLRGIESSEALELLRVCLSRDQVQFGVTMITSWADWARFETRAGTSPRFQSLIAADSIGEDASVQNALIEELSGLEPPEQVELLATLMLDVVASVLKADPASIPIDKSISQLGVDSLMATEIQMLFDTQLGLNISVLELIGDGTVRTLAASSLKKLVG